MSDHKYIRYMLKLSANVLSVAILAGCSQDPPEIRACEAYVKAIIDTPATYKRATASTFENTDNDRSVQTVILNYDASNGFGVPIRTMQVCDFKIVNGKPDTRGYEKGEGLELYGALHKLDEATGQGDKGCCL